MIASHSPETRGESVGLTMKVGFSKNNGERRLDLDWGDFLLRED